MNYMQYYPVDVVNGEGVRCTLFVSGCEPHCKGCYNQASWRFNAGLPFDDAIAQQIINDLNDQRIPRQGLSLSGGDPFHPKNVPELIRFLTRVKAQCPHKDIWAWTGYRLEELTGEQLTLLRLIDVLVDGKFEQDKADPTLKWCGSTNQKIYDFRSKSR